MSSWRSWGDVCDANHTVLRSALLIGVRPVHFEVMEEAETWGCTEGNECIDVKGLVMLRTKL